MQGSGSGVSKKKKKYVMVGPHQQEEAAVRKRRSSPTSVLSRSRFQYSFEQMLNHVFAKLLPNSRFIIRFSEKLIFGREEEVDKLLEQLDQNTRYYCCFLLQLEDEYQRQDIEYEVEESYRAKLFGKKLIQKCIVELFQGTCYELQCTAFLKMFQTDRHERLFVRMSRQYVEQFLEKISSKARMVKQASISDRVSNRGNRKELRTQFQKIALDAEAFDVKNWKDFLQKSQKLDKKDIQIIQNKNAYGYTETYTVRLLCMAGEEIRKVQAFNYYFRHQNFIGLPLKDSQRKAAFLKKYGSFKENWLQMRMIRGFKNEKWDQKTVLYKLRCGQVPPRKTNFASEPIDLVLLVGLLPKVREYLWILQKQLNDVPMDDAKVELYLQLQDDLRDALKSNAKVEAFVQKFIKEYVGRFKDFVQSVTVKFLLRQIRLDLSVRAAKEQQFKKGVAIQLQSAMLKDISVHKFDIDFPVDQQFRVRVEKEGLLTTGIKEKTIYFLSSIDELPAALAIIQNIQLDFQSLDQETIQCKGRIKLVHYQQIIRSIKEDAQFAQVFITDPDSIDKTNFTISFIGPKKKTNTFARQVRNKIAQLQNSFGCYSEAVQQDVARFLMEDTEVQEQLLKKYKISIMVESGAKIDALLDIEPLAIDKKVNIIKSNNLSRVPFGSTIYFSGKDQLDCFNQTFLEDIKAKTKRTIPGVVIKKEDIGRKLTIFYKEAANHMELLSIAIDQRREQSFSLIFPLLQTKKYLNNVLTTLTSLKGYQQKKYSIILIDPNPSADVKSTVGLPESSSISAKEHVIVEWSCEGVAYSKSGSDKINDAVANGSSKCLLSLQDLTKTNRMATPKTHTCNLKSKTIRNIKTGQEVPLIEQNGIYQFTYKGYSFQLTPQQLNLVKFYRRSDMSSFYLPLMYYEIELPSMTQTNIFTGKQRKIDKSQRVVMMTSSGEYQGKVHAAYDVPSPQLVFTFLKEDSGNLGVAIAQVSKYLQSKRKRQIIPLKAISNELRGKLRELILARGQENDLVCSYDPNSNEVTAQCLDQRRIDRFKQVVQSQVDYMLSIEQMRLTSKSTIKQLVTYPSFWQQQTSDIQYFIVTPNSQQFKQVQTMFTVSPITALWRIQNKFLYRRYVDELQHLTFLNGGQKPKQLQLFHGTGQTKPQLIWEGCQGGFNINYSSNTNMLGMGVYFAQKSEYSHTYRHKSVNGSSMFLCSVIVGESQLMTMSHSNAHVLDTEVKPNSTGLKYESMLGKHHICDIYVIYKDKRAYPNYLIHFK